MINPLNIIGNLAVLREVRSLVRGRDIGYEKRSDTIIKDSDKTTAESTVFYRITFRLIIIIIRPWCCTKPVEIVDVDVVVRSLLSILMPWRILPCPTAVPSDSTLDSCFWLSFVLSSSVRFSHPSNSIDIAADSPVATTP